LYKVLRDFRSKEFHLQCAKEFLRVPERLDKLIGRSFDHFAYYDNREEPFHQRGDVPTSSRQTSLKLADQLAVTLHALKSVPVSGGLSFSYIDYNISPVRTTGNVRFESGASGAYSRSGGVDVLLVNAVDQTPILGEIKAEHDTTLLLALIQSLTYAIELATPSQRDRLSRTYPERFRFRESGPFIDIYILQVRPSKDEWTSKFLELVDPLAAKLLQLEFVPRIVRRIACLETAFADYQQVPSFEVRFVHESRVILSSTTA
jgi:hypothetical protein